MDINNLLKSVKNLSDYISVTQDLRCKYDNVKVEFAMTTVYSLKNIRSLEIEFFNKCDDTGAAFIIFERMLQHPSSKTWSLLGKELVSLLQYWLDAVRKHLLNHHVHWWVFMKNILQFVNELLKKDSCFHNLFAEYVTDSFLDLATRGKLDAAQRFQVLHTFNRYCAETSKELRQGLRTQFEHYFVRLAAIMSRCGHVPTQVGIMETLLRWLVRRREAAARRDAADKWLPRHLYSEAAATLFVERPWHHFHQDVRDFLNMHNNNGDLVTSVVCRKLTVGTQVIITDMDRRTSYLDLNISAKSVSILLEPGALAALGAPQSNACGTLTVDCDVTTRATLHRHPVELTISLYLSAPPSLFPPQPCSSTEVHCEIAACDLRRLDRALRNIFQDKYQLEVDIDNELKAQRARRRSTEEDARSSNVVRRRRHAGHMSMSNRPESFRSPSSVSTSSLAQLHDKLAALPRFKFDKEPIGVCVTPSLSEVTELTEHDLNTTASTLKLRPCDYVTKRFRINMGSQSDTELIKKTADSSDSSDKRSDTTLKLVSTDKPKITSDILDEDSISCLLVTTIGTADQSVINDTFERLSKENDCRPDNIVDSLIRQALESKCDDSGINTGEVKKTSEYDSDVIENTYANTEKTKNNEVKSTSDESNTEATNDTNTNFVNVTKRSLQRTKALRRSSQTVEEEENDFFSQHISQNKVGEINISPTLAKKVNETSSEHSADFDEYVISNIEYNPNPETEFPDVDVIECLNDMVDKVCSDFDKCSEYLNRVDNDDEIMSMPAKDDNMKEPLQDIGNIPDQGTSKATTKKKPKSKTKPTQNINLIFTKKKTPKIKLTKNKLKLEPVTKMSIILEANNEMSDSEQNDSAANKKRDTRVSTELTDLETPLIRRKRKLYSPKADVLPDSIRDDKDTNNVEDINFGDEIALSELKKTMTPKNSAAAASYKDIQRDRQKYRKIRCKKSIEKRVDTRTDDIFDKLKEKIDNNVKITVAEKKGIDKDIGVFNFTSDSDDEDFKQKKIELQKRVSTTTIDSGRSIISSKRRPRTKVKYNENGASTDESKTKAKVNKRKRPTKRKNPPKGKETTTAINIEPVLSLVDERMRDIPNEDLNTSFVAEKEINTDAIPDPMISKHEMEIITNNENMDEITPYVEAISSNADIADNLTTDPIEILQNNCEIKIVEDTNDNRPEVNEKKTNKKLLKCKKRDTSKNTNTNKSEKEGKNGTKKVKDDKVSDIDDNRTISPLPGLQVETETKESTKFDDSLTTNLERKFKKIYQEGPDAVNDTNTTHNLLSDLEKSNLVPFNLTDQLNTIEDNFNGFESNRDNDSVKDDNASVCSSTKKRKRSLRLKTTKNKSINKLNKLDKASSSDCGDNAKIIRVKTDDLLGKQVEGFIDLTHYSQKTDNIINTVKSRNNSEHKIKTINISDATEVKSEKSIATVGITAHGVIEDDEKAGNIDALDETFIPRELADMEDSLKEYYIKLRREVHRMEKSQSRETVNSKKDKTDTSESIEEPERISKDKTEHRIVRYEMIQSPIKKNVLNDDLYLASRRNSDSHESNVTAHTIGIRSPIVSLPRMSPVEIRKWTQNSYERKSKTPKRKPKEKSYERKSETPIKKPKRKSIISPIKLFDDLKPRFKRNISDETNNISKTTPNSSVESPKPRYPLRNLASSTPVSKISTSTRLERKTTPKRVFNEEDFPNKRRFVETDSVSGKSSVKAWLTDQNAGSSRATDVDLTLRDAVQNIMERLDTTLAEIHQKTTENFIQLFVDSQKQLSEMKEQRREAQRKTAAKICELRRVIDGLDQDIADLDKRSLDMEQKFTDWLKRSAAGFIRNDCNQKRTMMELLREDLQAVIDQADRD